LAKIIILGDTHLGVRNDSPIFREYFKKSSKWLFDYIDKHEIKHVIHNGDLFDRQRYLNYDTANVCRTHFLQPLADRQIETHIITGNHDAYFKHTLEVNSLDEIVRGRYASIRVYTDAQVIKIEGMPILLIPWICAENRERTQRMIKHSKAEVAVGHLELESFEMYRGVVMEHGDDPEEYSRFDLVFSGHFHRKSSKKNIHYIGAFAEYTWADYNDDRGFVVFDTTTREWEHIVNPHKMFEVIPYDDVKDPNILETILQTDYSVYRDKYIKVAVANRTNLYSFDHLLDKLYTACPADIVIVEDPGVSSTVVSDEVELNPAEDTQTILNKYIGNLSLPVDSNVVKKHFRELFTEASSS